MQTRRGWSKSSSTCSRTLPNTPRGEGTFRSRRRTRRMTSSSRSVIPASASRPRFCPRCSTFSPRGTVPSLVPKADSGSASHSSLTHGDAWGNGYGNERRPRQGERIHRATARGQERCRGDSNAAGEAAQATRKCRILVVDDNVDTALGITAILKPWATMCRRSTTDRRLSRLPQP